jgi:t-SNARE complex subunit (syntaxin)
LDYSNHELILERQKKFKQLEGDIVDLNSMFKDLAVMVHDQGEIIGINLIEILHV